MTRRQAAVQLLTTILQQIYTSASLTAPDDLAAQVEQFVQVLATS
jgi:hypothetical protein